MGIRTALKLLEGGKALSPATSGSQSGIISPSQVGSPTKLVWSDIFGADAVFVTREEAMTLPPVAKGRAILTGQIAPAPLRAYDKNGLAAEQPKWLWHTDGAVSPHLRMLWTVDDLIFAGFSLWGTTRDAAGAITDATRIPIEWWTFDAEGRIVVQGELVDELEVILIPGPSEGLLQFATRSIRAAIALEHSYIKRAQNPIPLVELHETTEGSLEEDEIEDMIQAYADARQDENGTVTFTPATIELKVHGEQSPQLAIEGRNFAKIDVANFMNLPGAALDGSLSTASLTYSTGEDKRNEIADYSIAYWADPIAARFSQDDVVGEGIRVRHDFSELRSVNPSPTGAITKD
jgi:hypothetical protein